MQQILANLPQDPIVSGSAPWRIPVWFVLLRATNGSTLHPDYEIESNLEFVNQYFDGLFEFTLCGNAVLNDDRFSDFALLAPSDIPMLNQTVNQLYQPTIGHCVKVFLCDQLDLGSGYTYPRYMDYEDGAVIISSEDSRTLAHELGHYFGLPHTFGNAGNQYVHDYDHPEDHPVNINNQWYTCDQTGDGFCDTPADLENCIISGACSMFTCDPATDPLGLHYAPDPTLLMSYYGNCRNRFSFQQNTRMGTLYNFHEAYIPLSDIPSQCGTHTGKIVRECLDIGGQVPLPMVDLNVDLQQVSQGPCSDMTTLSGRYEINKCNWGDGKRSVLPDLLNYTNPLNGVTTFDLVLISKHILGIAPLDSPFKLIGADATNNGAVQTSDIVAIRKVILGIEPTFPYASWRYLPDLCLNTQSFYDDFYDGIPFDAEFTEPFQNFTLRYLPPPSMPGVPPVITLPNNTMWMDHVNIVTSNPLAQLEKTWSFTAIKVGDVNCDAISSQGVIDSSPSDISLGTSNGTPIVIAQGASTTIQILAESEEEIVSWQIGAKFPSSALHIESLFSGNTNASFDPENFHITSDPSPTGNTTLKAIWFSEDGTSININGKALFGLSIQANASISALENVIKLSPQTLGVKFYNEFGEEVPVTLKLAVSENNSGYRPSTKAGSWFSNEDLMHMMVSPNPAADFVNFVFDLEADQYVAITLFDSKGQVILQKNERLYSGLQEVSFPEISRCNAGLIFYTIKAGKTIQQGKFIKR